MKLMESKIYQFGFVVYDYLMLNFITTFFSIPIVTIVPAINAGIHCHKNKKYDLKFFFENFKKNYINLTFVSNIYLVLMIILGSYIFKNLKQNIYGIKLALILFCFIEIIFAFLQLFKKTVFLKDSIKSMVLESFIQGNLHLKQNIIFIIILSIYLFFMLFIETLAFFIFSFFIVIYTKVYKTKEIF